MQEELWRGQTCKMQSLTEETLAKVRASTFGIADDCSRLDPAIALKSRYQGFDKNFESQFIAVD